MMTAWRWGKEERVSFLKGMLLDVQSSFHFSLAFCSAQPWVSNRNSPWGWGYKKKCDKFAEKLTLTIEAVFKPMLFRQPVGRLFPSFSSRKPYYELNLSVTIWKHLIISSFSICMRTPNIKVKWKDKGCCHWCTCPVLTRKLIFFKIFFFTCIFMF